MYHDDDGWLDQAYEDRTEFPDDGFYDDDYDFDYYMEDPTHV